MTSRFPLGLLATAAVLAAAPGFAQPRDGTPGNPPSMAIGRTVDRAQGEVPRPDGTPGNPPGTAAGRAASQVLDSNGSDADRQAMDTQTTTRPDGATVTTTEGDAARTADAGPASDGRRASRVIGSNVYTDANESIGEIEDLIIPRQNGQPVAVLSVGGFLGIGAKRVAVPYAQLQYNAERERWVLPGATKDSLMQRPSFAYADEQRGGTRETTTGEGAAPRGTMGGGSGPGQPATTPPASSSPAR